MSKLITTSFLDDDGLPKTGLVPTIRIRDLSDNALVITDAAMSEVGDGGYKYTQVLFDQLRDYQYRCDAGSSISSRYAVGFSKGSLTGTITATAFFTDDDGIPATGLAPTIRIRNLATNALVVTDAVMTEVGDGGYKYIFAAYSFDSNYQARCDAGSTISSRYSFGFNGELVVEILELPLEGKIVDSLTLAGDIKDSMKLVGSITVK